MWSDDHKVKRCMSQLGARLREAREARGLTLAAAADGTRILPRYLQALEDGDYAQLPGDVYARGFIRNYAQFLDLSADELMQLYRRERGAPTDRIKVVPAAIPPRTRSCLMPSAFLSFFSILVLLGVLYLVAQASGLTRMPTDVAAGVTATPPRPTATAFPTSTAQPEGTPMSRLPATPTVAASPPPGGAPLPGSPEASPGASPAPTSSVPLVVEVRVAPDAVRGSWMTVSVDGRAGSYTGTLLANGTERFEAQREVYLHVGDASVVELIVNGVSRGRMCPTPGCVRKETITPQNPTGSTP